MATLDYLNKRIHGARLKIAYYKARAAYAYSREQHFIKVWKQNPPDGSPQRVRAKRKVEYWREAKQHAKRMISEWETILNRRIKKKLIWLKEHPPPVVSGIVTPNRAWNPYNRQVCGWMVPWLDKARERGWRGVVVSGVRTPAHSQGLCCAMCRACSPGTTCPGMCAGIYSNHNATTGAFPQGAIDVTDYWNLADIFREIGAPLKNDLPADRVHFSNSGH